MKKMKIKNTSSACFVFLFLFFFIVFLHVLLFFHYFIFSKNKFVYGCSATEGDASNEQLLEMSQFILVLTHKSLASFIGTYANIADPDQTPQRLIWVSTVCIQNVLSKLEWNRNILINNPLIRNRFVQLIMVGKSIRHRCVKTCKLSYLVKSIA